MTRFSHSHILSTLVTRLAGVLMCVCVALTAQAQTLPHTPVQPAQPGVAPEALAFADRAYNNARLFSPFAAYDAEEVVDEAEEETAALLDYAAGFLGTRYRLGAMSPRAFDCSGFTGYVFRNFGIELHRTSREQYKQGEKVARADLRPGDLVFFSSRRSGRGRVGHVGIVTDIDPETGTPEFIHASTKHGVIYTKLEKGSYYDRNYVGARRML